jgi:hypothetical protein
MHSLRSLLSPARGALAALTIAATLYGCSSAGKPRTTGETGGESGDTGGTGGSTAAGGTGGKATGGSTGSGGASGGSGGSAETGGSGGGGGASATGGSSGAGGGFGTGGAGAPDASAADSSAPAADGGYKLDPKSPIVACNGGYNLQGVTADDFCSVYEMYCMYDPTGMAKNPSGTALPPGTGSWFYKDRADCITRYNMASMPATGHFSNCP